MSEVQHDRCRRISLERIEIHHDPALVDVRVDRVAHLAKQCRLPINQDCLYYKDIGGIAIWRVWIDQVKTMSILVGLKNPMLKSGEYPDNNDFPDQLYARMGRRMVRQYVVTQQDLMHQTAIKDSIGLAYYAVDIYRPRLIAHDG